MGLIGKVPENEETERLHHRDDQSLTSQVIGPSVFHQVHPPEDILTQTGRVFVGPAPLYGRAQN